MGSMRTSAIDRVQWLVREILHIEYTMRGAIAMCEDIERGIVEDGFMPWSRGYDIGSVKKGIIASQANMEGMRKILSETDYGKVGFDASRLSVLEKMEKSEDEN